MKKSQGKNSPEFSKRLQEAMVSCGIKPSKLAHLAGVSSGYVSDLLNGKKFSPSPEVLSKFAKILSTSPHFLLSKQQPSPLSALPPDTDLAQLVEVESQIDKLEAKKILINSKISALHTQLEALTTELNALATYRAAISHLQQKISVSHRTLKPEKINVTHDTLNPEKISVSHDTLKPEKTGVTHDTPPPTPQATLAQIRTLAAQHHINLASPPWNTLTPAACLHQLQQL